MVTSPLQHKCARTTERFQIEIRMQLKQNNLNKLEAMRMRAHNANRFFFLGGRALNYLASAEAAIAAIAVAEAN